MKKVWISVLGFVFVLGVLASSVNAASASVTSRKSDNAAKEVTVIGEGKYVKFTCTYNGKKSDFGNDGYCELSDLSKPGAEYLGVGGSYDKVRSTDYYMNKGVKYLLKADVEYTAPSGSSTTASIR